MTAPLKDMKSGRAGGKPDLTHNRKAPAVYRARQGQYGSAKYQRSNFLREVGEAPHPNKHDFERFREYLRASLSHTMETLDSMERHQANDPNLLDIEGMKRACFAVDTDPGNDHVGPSNLPHIGGSTMSLEMAITQAVECGLLPADPGMTWTETTAQPVDDFEEWMTVYWKFDREDFPVQRDVNAGRVPDNGNGRWAFYLHNDMYSGEYQVLQNAWDVDTGTAKAGTPMRKVTP